MGNPALRLKPLTNVLRSVQCRARYSSEQQLASSAIVFAPHQDDETLGCGGTILRKRRLGARVIIAFMTDGSTSHASFVDPLELKHIRHGEAIHAAEALGLEQGDLEFFDFPDSRLEEFHIPAATAVRALLQRHRPAEVFIPYRNDGTPDHEATSRIVTDAVRTSRLQINVYEYPIWFWNQWPWVSLRLGADRQFALDILRSLRFGMGLSAFVNFRHGTFVGDVLDQKRHALEKHCSQLLKARDARWPTLSDVSDGEFLPCFFQDFELFRCWSSGAEEADSRS
jgi:LmbE family N-acetylglucosaminyl deacetylase